MTDCTKCSANIADGTDGLCTVCRSRAANASPLLQRFEAWMQTTEGRLCRDRDFLLAPSQGRYLDDRLQLAFMAGAFATYELETGIPAATDLRPSDLPTFDQLP